MKVKSCSRVQLFMTPWTAAYQAPVSMGFSRQEYWSGLPLPSPPFIATLIFTFCLLLALAQFALHFSSSFKVYGGFPGGSDGKESACNVGDLGSIPREDPLEKGTATHSIILASRIPWTEEPGSYSPWGCRHD